ncbi:MAG: oxidoreductase [Magnetovibrionaceae bacterium]
MATPKARKPKLAVWKFASCDGCQLSLLDCEDELLAVAEAVEIAYFLEATRARVKGPFDISLVEGSITTTADANRLQRIRRQSRILISIGACATAGGIQALRNGRDIGGFISTVYAEPRFIDTLETSRPIRDLVKVDYELRGCPIDRGQLLSCLIELIQGRSPRLSQGSQCMECKAAGTVCVMVARGEPCLGPVTQRGCGNLCPGFGRGCYGCFGPKRRTNAGSLADHLDLEGEKLANLFETFNAAAPAFHEAGERLRAKDSEGEP